MILSYITERMRMSKKSQLFGSWIPLRKTQGFAVDCPIQPKATCRQIFIKFFCGKYK